MSHRKAIAWSLWGFTLALIVVAFAMYSGHVCEGAGAYPWEVIGAGALASGAMLASISARSVVAIVVSIAVGGALAGVLLFLGVGLWVSGCTA